MTGLSRIHPQGMTDLKLHRLRRADAWTCGHASSRNSAGRVNALTVAPRESSNVGSVKFGQWFTSFRRLPARASPNSLYVPSSWETTPGIRLPHLCGGWRGHSPTPAGLLSYAGCSSNEAKFLLRFGERRYVVVFGVFRGGRLFSWRAPPDEIIGFRPQKIAPYRTAPVPRVSTCTQNRKESRRMGIEFGSRGGGMRGLWPARVESAGGKARTRSRCRSS